MADARPRLPTGLPGNQTSYAPINFLAAASLGAAGLYALGIVVFGLIAFRDGKSLFVEWLLVVAAAAVVLAFVARRQIRGSEGTQTGERYANLGWTIGFVGGVGYIAYLLAVQYAVRRDAEKEFGRWAGQVAKLDPANPHDPALAAAAYYTLSAGQRASVKGETDVAGMEAGQRDALLILSVSDLARVCRRNPGAVTITGRGVQKWDQRPTEISCTLTGTAVTPEGEFRLVVPMQAEYDQLKQRQWRVLPPSQGAGYIERRELTEYGWQLDALEQSGRAFAQQLFGLLAKPGGSNPAYTTFVAPEFEPDSGASAFNAVMQAKDNDRLAGVTGAAPAAVVPNPPGAEAYLTTRVFGKPDGAKLEPAEADKFRYAWSAAGRLVPAGSAVKGNPDVNPAVAVVDGVVEVSVPAEMQLTAEASPPTARAAVVLRLSPAGQAKLGPDLARMKADPGPRTVTPPADIVERVRTLPWRVTRITSDLRPLPKPERAPPGGQPGMGG